MYIWQKLNSIGEFSTLTLYWAIQRARRKRTRLRACLAHYTGGSRTGSLPNRRDSDGSDSGAPANALSGAFLARRSHVLVAPRRSARRFPSPAPGGARGGRRGSARSSRAGGCPAADCGKEEVRRRIAGSKRWPAVVDRGEEEVAGRRRTVGRRPGGGRGKEEVAARRGPRGGGGAETGRQRGRPGCAGSPCRGPSCRSSRRLLPWSPWRLHCVLQLQGHCVLQLYFAVSRSSPSASLAQWC